MLDEALIIWLTATLRMENGSIKHHHKVGLL